MFLLFGHRATKIAEEQTKVNDQGEIRNAIVQVYQRYAHLFWIPLFPLYRNYVLFFPDTGATYAKTLISNRMPKNIWRSANKCPQERPGGLSSGFWLSGC